MNIRIHISKQGYDQKPQKKEIALISRNITEHITTIEISEFAREVGENGKTFTPALFNGSRRTENFFCQQVFALDFDGGMTVENFMDRVKLYQVFPAFVYATYSYSEEKHRFRAVFINDCEVADSRAAHIIIRLLSQLFPEADQQCKDLSRMFFGGKRLLYVNENARIGLFDLSVSVQTYIKIKDPKNYSRKMKSVADGLGVVWNGKTLGIYKCQKGDENEEILTDTDHTIIVNVSDSSNYCIFQKDQTHPSCLRHKKTTVRLRNKTLEEVKESCPLFRDFYEDAEAMDHKLKFLLATNLYHVDGGKDMFFYGLRDKEKCEHWKTQWKYIADQFYHPMKCRKGDCPYVEVCRCDTLLEKLKGKIQRIVSQEEMISLEEAVKQLRNILEECYNNSRTGIYLIAAQTAMGKTTAYCDLIEKYNCESKKVLVAVPTNKLQDEVAEELKKRGIEVFCTPNINKILQHSGFQELQIEVQRLYDSGYGYKVKRKIREYQDKYADTMTEAECGMLEYYLNCREKLDGTSCVVTTHKLFLNLSEEILQQYEVIVDEDILMSIFKDTASISFDELYYAIAQGAVPEKYRYRVERLLQMPDESVGFTGIGKLCHGERDEIYEKDLDLDASLIGFLESLTYHIDGINKKINYFAGQPLPKIKMMIVSATLKPDLYKDYCRDFPIFFNKVGNVKYRGKLLQYTFHSASRHYLEQVGYEEFENRVKELVGHNDIDIITFKKYSRGREIYFGKTEGFNQYKGHDIAVIGTPYSIPFAYRLIGMCLGYEKSDHMCRRMATYNGYKFPIMSFGTSQMQELLFYFLESELEQAIGRARLLRYDCTVYLFSNFPCRQAELIQEEYFSDNAQKKEELVNYNEELSL